MQEAFRDLRDNQTETFNASDWKFVWVDDRFDEHVVQTFGKRMYPHIWVIDKETGKSYSWDMPMNHINSTVIRDWVLNKTYRDSIL
jgi:hypothetical protein